VAATTAAVAITLPEARSLAVHVVQAADQAPVDYAQVAVLAEQHDFLPLPFAVARTDRAGDATLAQLPAQAKLVVRVTHPGYAPGVARFEPGAAGPIVVALLRGGDLVGAVTADGKPPSKLAMLVLTRSGSGHELPEDEFPRLAVTFPDGTFRLRHLAAGAWKWQLYPRFLATDAMGLVKSAMDEPDELAKGECAIEEGKETRLAIEALSDAERLPGTIRGRVRVSGRAEEGLQVRVFGRRYLETKTDAAGRFELADVKPGEYRIQVSRDGEGSRATLHDEALVLASGEMKEVDVDVRLEEVTFAVSTHDGHPVAGASLQVVRDESDATDGGGTLKSYFGHASGTTDASGKAQLSLGAGRFRATASHSEQGRGTVKFAVAAGQSEVVELVLDPGVTVAGRFLFGGALPEGEEWHLTFSLVSSEEDFVAFDEAGVNWRTVAGGETHFEVKAVMPGHYQAQLYTDDGVLQSQEFDVGRGGERDLVLEMKAQE
jgi:hypothetical protein